MGARYGRSTHRAFNASNVRGGGGDEELGNSGSSEEGPWPCLAQGAVVHPERPGFQLRITYIVTSSMTTAHPEGVDLEGLEWRLDSHRWNSTCPTSSLIRGQTKPDFTQIQRPLKAGSLGKRSIQAFIRAVLPNPGSSNFQAPPRNRRSQHR